MNSNAILIQGHVPQLDPQGSLYSRDKLDIFNLSLRHLRKNNPDAYIACTGHGAKPEELDHCVDWYYWEDICRPIDENGLVIGSPAQYHFLGIGLQYLYDLGFDTCLKTRLDCLIGRPNIIKFCEEICEKENKQFLITQMTANPLFLGDCFLWGQTKVLLDTWHKNNSLYDKDGLLQTGFYFYQAIARKYLLGNKSWKDSLKEVCSFIDLWEIPLMDMRWTYYDICYKYVDWFKFQDHILESKDLNDYREFLWGKKNGWHVFDSDGNMIHGRKGFWSKKEFYA